MTPLTLPIEAHKVLLHRPPMQLLSRLVHYETGGSGRAAEAQLDLAAGHPLLDGDGRLDPVFVAEALAQTIAAIRGWEGLLSGLPPALGFLTGIDDFQAMEEAHRGVCLTLRVVQQTVIGPVSIYEGRAIRGRHTVATGTLKVWEAERQAATPERETDRAGCPAWPSDLTEAPPPSAVPPGEPSPADRIDWALLSCMACEKQPQAKVNDTHTAAVRFILPPGFTGFAGHFPGYPILPGVVMLKMAALVAGMIAGGPVVVATIERAKFTRQVFPGQTIDVTLERLSGKGPAAATAGPDPATGRFKARLACPDAPAAHFTFGVRPR